MTRTEKVFHYVIVISFMLTIIVPVATMIHSISEQKKQQQIKHDLQFQTLEDPEQINFKLWQ